MRTAVVGLLLSLLSACVGRHRLDDVVRDYDEALSRTEAEMLLLNIARARHGKPFHFTTVAGIAATFDFAANTGFGAEIAENPGTSLLLPSFGVSVSENPTINIVPVRGEEFTRRLLRPLDESTLGFFIHQGADPALLLRLLAEAIVVEESVDGSAETRRRIVPNDSSSDSEFDRFIVRVAEIDRAGQLDIGPLVFDQRFAIDGTEPLPAPDLVALLDQGYRIEDREIEVGDRERYLVRRVVGRSILSDQDPLNWSDAERASLQESAQRYPGYFVLAVLGDSRVGATVRSERAWIKLRSLAGVLDAVAAQVPETGFDPGPRVPLAIRRSDSVPDGALFSVDYEGAYFSLVDRPSSGDSVAFRVLERLLQMSMTEIDGEAVPPVTITK